MIYLIFKIFLKKIKNINLVLNRKKSLSSLFQIHLQGAVESVFAHRMLLAL